jgi:hypothetical protein
VTDAEGQLVRSRLNLQTGDALSIRFAADETVPVVVTGPHVEPRKKPRPTVADDPQESLF